VAHVLKLTQLAQRDSVPNVQIGASGIDAKFNAQMPAASYSLLKFCLSDDLINAAGK